jgi:ribosomal protein S18 acetylase RimI-like enzyme
MPSSLAVAATAPGDDRDEAVEILIAAFRDDPAIRSLYPTDIEYVRFFPGFAMAFGGRAFTAGTVDLDADGHAVALWFPPGIAPDRDAVMNHLARSTPKSRLNLLAAALEMRAGLHPSEPHWYLPWMGVMPEAQGMGIGSALLREGLARADADRLPVYLEATTRRSAAFYARHGFETKTTIRPPDHPEVISMWRPA